MAEELEKQASAAFLDEDFESAVELFTKAIAADPDNAASLLTSRAQANLKLQNFTDAVADANKAIELNPSISKAFLRKGIACYQLEEYETAKSAFASGANLEPSNSAYQDWLKKCDEAIAAEDAGTGSQFAKEGSRNGGPLNVNDGYETGTHTDSFSSENQPKPVQKFRHTFYQRENEAVVEILAKGLKSEEVKVEFGVQSLKVSIESPANEPYSFQTRLNQKVVIEKCKYAILSTKVEIRLAKAESLNWPTLEYNESQVAVHAPTVAKSVAQKIDYPSSSKKAHKDWDKIEAEVKKEEKDEKLEGDAALNKLFRDIYQNADEDTRRAMNKSFVESNGTVLSTNWKDVGKKYVEGSPPSGMEMKKWEQ
eukprot:c10934_g1_i1 orf=145-1248(+)